LEKSKITGAPHQTQNLTLYDNLLQRGLFEDTRGGGGDGGDWDIVDLYGAGRVISTSKPRNPMKSSVSQSFNFRRAEYL
jgi:hypothetical protein